MSILDQVASGGLTTIIGEALSIVNKFVKDPEQQVQAQIEIMKIQQSDKFKEIDAALQEKQMQADINKVEAASDKLFVAGPRPFIMWICGVAFGLQFVIFPLSVFIASLFGTIVTMPILPMEALMTVLMGTLGLGAMRSYDKSKGVKNGGA